MSRCGPRAGSGRLGRKAQVFSPSIQPWLQLCPGSAGLRAVLSVKAEGTVRMTGAPAELSDFPLPAHSSPVVGVLCSAGIPGVASFSGLLCFPQAVLPTPQVCL